MGSAARVVTKPDEPPAISKTTERDLRVWQRHLLPFMTGFIVFMAVAFFCFSGLHLYQVTTFIETEHGQSIRTLIESEIGKPIAEKRTSEEIMQRSLLLLEADALDKRYHQASALLMSRIWSRQLAFITGMVLAFVGAVFILGKLSEAASQISGGASEWKLAITSASPGIILTFFGTVLLISSLFVRASLDVADGPVYLNVLRGPTYNSSPAGTTPAKAEDVTQPLDLNELEKLDKQKSVPAQKQK
jgi:hypothetical protein